MSTDLEKITKCYDEVGIEYVVRSEGESSYLIVQAYRNIYDLDNDASTAELSRVLNQCHFMEFENGKLAGY